MASHSLWEAGWDGSDPGPAPLLGRCFHGLWMLMQKKMLPQIRRKDRS